MRSHDGCQWSASEHAVSTKGWTNTSMIDGMQGSEEANQTLTQSTQILYTIVIVSQRTDKDTSNHAVGEEHNLCL